MLNFLKSFFENYFYDDEHYAALFFLTDTYAFILSFFAGIVDMTTIYRTIPLVIILPLGVYIGDKFFVKAKKATYRKAVLYLSLIHI